MENKKQLGGKRKGAGRKPVLSKKKQISLYVEGSKILKFGNEEKYKEFLYRQTDEYGIEKDYSNPISELNNLPQYSVHGILPQVEVKSAVTGLAPKASLFTDFMRELDECKTFDAVEKVMKKAKGEAFLPRERMSLESKAKQVVAEKGLYND